MNRRLGWKIEEVRDFEFEHNGDRLGWIEGTVIGILLYLSKMAVLKILKIIN